MDKPREAPNHPLADPAHFAEGFHTAFRKGMDGPLSAHIHAIVRAVPDPVYGRFVDHVTACIDEEAALDAAILRDACLSWDPRRAFAETSPKLPHAQLLAGGLALLADGDWRSIAEFLNSAHDPFLKDREAHEAREIADWAGLAGDARAIEPRVSLVLRDGGEDRVVGEIHARFVMGEPDADGRRRRVIGGWSPRLEGFPAIKASDGAGFVRFEDAYGAAVACAGGLHARHRDYLRSRMRGRDPAWAEAHGPVIERVCAHLATRHDPGSREGSRIRRYLYGPEYALQAYRAAVGSTKQGPAAMIPIDREPLPYRLEWLLRALARELPDDGPDGFLVNLALYGDKAALRRADRRDAEYHFRFSGTPWRTARDLLDAWNAPDGLPPGPHALPEEGGAPPIP